MHFPFQKSVIIFLYLIAQAVGNAYGASLQPNPVNVEVESLFPMYFFGGYHLGVGLRYGTFRVRASIINSGHYDVEPDGLSNDSGNFQRFYADGSYGFFGDYFLDEHWHVYGFLEHHCWTIRNKKNGAMGSLQSLDRGLGIGFQYFFYHNFYIQPAVHAYFRDRLSQYVGGREYTLPGIDLSPVIRIGLRL